MVEPIRELLDAGVSSDKEITDLRGVKPYVTEIMDVKVELTDTYVGHSSMTLRKLMEFKPGDIYFHRNCQSIITRLMKNTDIWERSLGTFSR